MRLINILIFALCWVSFASAGTPGTPAAAGFAKAGFVTEFSAGGVRKLLGGNRDQFFVAKQDGSVDEIDNAGRKTLTLQAKDGAGVLILKQAEAVAVADGIIYVADSETRQVAMFSLEGKYKGSFGAKKSGFFGGGAEIELSSPRGIAVHEGIVYVSDTGNGKVQLFGPNGVFLATLEIESSAENNEAQDKGLPYRLREPTDIAVNGVGQIYVLDASDSLVKVYNPHGKYLKHLEKNGTPLAFSLAADGIYVADRDTLIIHRYDFNDKLTYSFGARGEGRALFKSISGLVAGNDRQVYVGDSKQGLVHVFQAESAAPLELLPRAASRISVQVLGEIPVSVAKLAWNGKDTIYAIDTTSVRLN